MHYKAISTLYANRVDIYFFPAHRNKKKMLKVDAKS